MSRQLLKKYKETLKKSKNKKTGINDFSDLLEETVDTIKRTT